MAKFHGMIGFGMSEETVPGVWVEIMREREYAGEVLRAARRSEKGESVNDNISVTNQLSIVADPFANVCFFAIRYVKWAGAAWKVTNVEAQAPRLILTLGGVYHGPEA